MTKHICMEFTSMSYFETRRKILWVLFEQNHNKLVQKPITLWAVHTFLFYIREHTKCRRRFLFLRAGV